MVWHLALPLSRLLLLFFFLIRRPPPRSTLFPYTTLFRLLVAEPAYFGFRVIDAFSRIVRVGEGLGLGNCLSEGAIDRTIDALRVCKGKMESRGVKRARMIATEASRAANNGADFVARVR